jgi:DNA-binding protein HU-beta
MLAVNKRDMVSKIAFDAKITRVQAARALEALLAGIQASLARGDRVTLSGFGSFGVTHRKPRRVRNPRSGHEMQVQAKRVPRFAPGVELKEAVRNQRSA